MKNISWPVCVILVIPTLIAVTVLTWQFLGVWSIAFAVLFVAYAGRPIDGSIRWIWHKEEDMRQ